MNNLVAAAPTRAVTWVTPPPTSVQPAQPVAPAPAVGTSGGIQLPNPNANPNAQAQMGAQGWAQVGLGAFGQITNMIATAKQHELIKQQMAEEKKQREIENQRYNQQMQRNIQATDDAANTSSSLQSAGSNFSGNQATQGNGGGEQIEQKAPPPRMSQY